MCDISLVLVCKLIDDIGFTNLSGSPYFQSAVTGFVFPIHKLLIDISFNIHSNSPF